ncbi:hypothetical protein Cob_v005405 [Colletotrichum orbiculare MAFF 240422]|uniref:ubiquitinyl hydrolase 1 n=1 Tax=Colletotrichum orbiculare (strain 104-T / ATCC 96160 / CBS 514.97 / LARS 414 / MAFF 240422) TaxID=1213857 RepID=A0A484FX80_COLOR|nr:hypothetical protein Cob_v005405 [Colletotrichum orbiculare MAFF 240422]
MVSHRILKVKKNKKKKRKKKKISIFVVAYSSNLSISAISVLFVADKSHVAKAQLEPVTLVTNMLHKMLAVHRPLGGRSAVDDEELVKSLCQLLDSGGSIGLHIREQNAGVLISQVNSALNVEAFELSPSNRAVIKTAGRLRRTFPGTAVSISLKNAREDGFITTLAATLSKMSTQPCAETKPKVKKAGQLQDENRDTTHPKMVTELLNAFLTAVGQPAACDRIWKNTREEVLWRQARLPWRRSPTWMLIRVVLQLTFIRSAESSQCGVKLYKTFMIFLMASVLGQGLDNDLDSDVLYSMVAKLSRRMLKIGSESPNIALDFVRDKMRRANNTLRERWATFQKMTLVDLTKDFSRLKTIDFSQDAVISLPSLDSFLDSIGNRQNENNSRVFSPSWTLTKYGGLSSPTSVDSSDKDHLQLHIVAFESWVEMHLERWMSSQLDENHLTTCSQLRQLIESYHVTAGNAYSGNPESTSIMLLTIMELWVACDKAAVHAHPLLADYDPGVPRGLFQNLLLQSRRQMERLLRIEQYLMDRSSECNSLLPAFHIYKSFGASDTFAVRYFERSRRHQALLLLIEDEATEQREAKRCELTRLRDEYKDLMRRVRDSVCTYVNVLDRDNGSYYQTHDTRCTRCRNQREAESLQIYVHEWPLPENPLHKMSVVFELELPQTFGYWREACFYVLHNVLKMQHANTERPQSQYPLHNYDALRPYYKARVASQQVGLLSETKPNVVVHRNPVLVASASEKTVLLNNGLRFMYYDYRRSCFIRDLSETNKIPIDCTYSLPSCSASLQRFIFRPAAEPSGPSPNSVIATQSNCPKDMTVEQYKAVASIPLGFRIQYQNILVQLFSPCLDFKKWEVALTVWQCIHQAGPDSGLVSRAAHDACEDQQFARRLLGGIKEATQRFEKNWQSSVALANFISWARRLLTLAGSAGFEMQCLSYLHEARNITFSWAMSVREKARKVVDDGEKISLQRRAMELFLIVSDTFNNDADHQQTILSQTEKASLYFQCAVCVHEYSESQLGSLGAPVRYLYARWQRTLYNCYQYLAMSHNVGAALDEAIRASWPAYQPSDLLTGKTGTEEALTILGSAAAKSFDRLSDDNHGLFLDHGTYERRYAEELEASFQALRRKGMASSNAPDPESLVLERYLRQCKAEFDRQYDTIVKALLGLGAEHMSKASEVFDVYSRPRISPTLILQRLNKDHFEQTPVEWRQRIADYGVALTQLQRAEKLVGSIGDPVALEIELRNPGHTNWKPLDFPDALLLEVDSGMMVREVQENVAERMRNPPSGKNTTMQLNMGEGKSSVIVPIVAAALADGFRLVRVIVAKPQSKQMQQMLESQLGGLVNRRVFHLPFSRAIKVGPKEVETLKSICMECMKLGGILLVQPEHLLSFQLMGIETAITGKMDVSRSLLKLKDVLDRSTRDIVDESDENFSVKFELVYTIGTQQPIEHSPDRWGCNHHVLDIVRRAVPQLEQSFPNSIETSPGRPGCFPRLRILRDDAKDSLNDLVARQLSQEGLTGLPMATQPKHIQSAVFNYITKTNLSQAEIDAVEKSSLWSPLTQHTLLLLRGLVASQILGFVFCQKRWKVDYGLDPTRNPTTRLAVPYRAKDSPTARSEFSHPEIIIMLTSLSYYYGGMTDEDLVVAFGHLLRCDQADMEYQVWVADSDQLPHAFCQLSGINLDDHEQCAGQVFPCFRYAKGAIDYFLAHIVFPKELKEFPHKLSASGWDIGEEKPQPTTGFSGTNDSRAFLPLTVSQLDDEDQQHTNAQVLEYLLQDDSLVALMPKQKATGKTDAEMLLGMVTHLQPSVKVILDMTKESEDTQAVIFCDENDRLCVVDRRGRVESFQTSPFAGQVDVCLVFLDEAHTRGTDLKLPANYRAAVTLNASLTKDRLVQACMRMRKLGKGQSVTFCVPDEIQQKIRSRHAPSGSAITVLDILEWAISETFTELRRGIWLWASQGRRHHNHRILWREAQANGSTELYTDLAERFLEEEAQTLETRYRPMAPTKPTPVLESSTTSSAKGPDAITERVIELEGLEEESATFREEQERELSPEVEPEREIQRPPPAEPAAHFVHPDIRRFVSHGVLPMDSASFMPAFKALSDTTAARYFDAGKLPTGLLATLDFVRTIKPPRGSHLSDLFHRSVQWILTCASNTGVIDTAIIISPYEAQELLPGIKASVFVSLHVYSPRPNMGFRPLDDLDLYTVPHRDVSPAPALPLRTQLNLFSGQLYLKSMEDYYSTRQFLQLCSESSNGEVTDKSVSRAPESGNEALMQFIKVLMMQVRRSCESIDKTHMGRILDHRMLGPLDFN